MNLVVGASGVLGSAIMQKTKAHAYPGRLEAQGWSFNYEVAYLCAGTKGFRENEGNQKSFQADVDGNVRLAKMLLKAGSFVVFISTEAVEWGAQTAYARNRLLVEQALWMQDNTAIIRPGKFDRNTVGPLADLCLKVANQKLEGVHYWRPDA